MNNDLLKLTQLIYACWLAPSDKGDVSSPKEALPTIQGVMDYTLKELKDEPEFPDWARSTLHFSVRDSGLTCLELPEIRLYANRLGLTTDPNPSYVHTTLAIDQSLVPLFSSLTGIQPQTASVLGEKMRGLVGKYQDVFAVTSV